MVKTHAVFRCKAITHLEELVDVFPPVFDPVGDAPDDCVPDIVECSVAAAPVIVAEFTSDTPYQLPSTLAWWVEMKR